MKNCLLKVPMRTQSYADTLVAVGLASLIEEHQLEAQPKVPSYKKKVRIERTDWYYKIENKLELDLENFKRWQPKPGFKFPLFKEMEIPAGAEIYTFYYEKEKQKAENWREYNKANKNLKNLAAEQIDHEAGQPSEPDSKLGLYITLNIMSKGSPTFTNLFKYIWENDLGKEVADKLIEFGWDHEKIGEIKDINKKAGISGIQIFNPIAGKGINKAKANGVSAGSFNNTLDWFEEWMKYRAMDRVMFTYNTPDKDIKVFVLSPSNIMLKDLETLHRTMLKEIIFGTVKLDILFLLILVRNLIEKSKFMQEDGIEIEGRAPVEIIEGINTVFFKNLGSATATMNVSFLALPGWFPIQSIADAESWLEIIAEHEKNIKALEEKKPGDMNALLKFREYISSGNLMDLLEFLYLYAVILMKAFNEFNRWLKPFTTKNIRRVCMDYQEITRKEGFQSIATAIRKATISPQIRKAKGRRPPFKIHYGLAQEWKRRAKNEQQFITVLSEFIQDYNAENARNMELGKESRLRIEQGHIDEVLELIKNHGVELIAMLLLAYGFAKDDSAKEDTVENEEEKV
jgi:hypothetical protein